MVPTVFLVLAKNELELDLDDQLTFSGHTSAISFTTTSGLHQ